MKITMYTKEDCPPCERVEMILRAEGYELNVIPANLSRETARILREANAKGFPAVFRGTEYLGSGIMAVHKVDPDINLVEHLKRGGRNEK